MIIKTEHFISAFIFDDLPQTGGTCKNSSCWKKFLKQIHKAKKYSFWVFSCRKQSESLLLLLFQTNLNSKHLQVWSEHSHVWLSAGLLPYPSFSHTFSIWVVPLELIRSYCFPPPCCKWRALARIGGNLNPPDYRTPTKAFFNVWSLFRRENLKQEVCNRDVGQAWPEYDF